MRNGITIQQRPCPWCQHRLRPVGHGAIGLLQPWSPLARTEPVREGQNALGSSWQSRAAPFLFGPRVTARLEVYRMAVSAGFLHRGLALGFGNRAI